MVEETTNSAPETQEIVTTTFEGENTWANMSEEEREAKVQEILDLAEAWTPFTDRKDQYRHPSASGYGGYQLLDQEQASKLRSAVGEIIAMAGRKIMSGDFNLTRISFPIKCMCPQSMLMTMTGFASSFPVYMNRAASTEDPVERMKLVMTANFSWFFYSTLFRKPLNPILGETYQAYGADGAKLYYEQTSHHPPRSHFIAEGARDNFKMNGYLEYEIYAGMQSSNVVSHGFKQCTFKDGTVIRWNQNNDYISGLFLGTMNHQLAGKVEFHDVQNDIHAFYEYGAYTFKKQDFIWGEIKQNGKKVCEVTGNYMGYMDYDEVRYWDVREKDAVYFPIGGEEPNSLPSQASKRTDGCILISGTVEEAQVEKERLENMQRNDRKLREEAAERRSKGGPKYKEREQEEAKAEAE